MVYQEVSAATGKPHGILYHAGPGGYVTCFPMNLLAVFTFFGLLFPLILASESRLYQNVYGKRARILKKCETALLTMKACSRRPVHSTKRFIDAYKTFEHYYLAIHQEYVDDSGPSVRYHYSQFGGLYRQVEGFTRAFLDGFEDFLDHAEKRMEKAAIRAANFKYALKNLYDESHGKSVVKTALDITAKHHRKFCNRQLALYRERYRRLDRDVDSLGSIFDTGSSTALALWFKAKAIRAAAEQHRLKVEALDRMLTVLGYKQ